MTLEEQAKNQLEAIELFGMFIEQITNLDDVEDADWEEETE